MIRSARSLVACVVLLLVAGAAVHGDDDAKKELAPGRVFGEPIPLDDWQRVVEPYKKLMGKVPADVQFRFYAYVKAAEKAGLTVTDEAVAERVVENVGLQAARKRAAERTKDLGLDPQSPEAAQRFRQFFFEEMGRARENFNDREYAEWLASVQMTKEEYEGQLRRMLLIQKLVESFEKSATVSTEEVKAEHRERTHARAAEIIVLEGAAYVPTATTVPTEREVKDYYESHRPLYEEPRRVALEYVAVSLEKTTAAAAQDLLDQVDAKLKEQAKTGTLDMKAAVLAVSQASSATALTTGTTPLLDADEVAAHPLLGGFAAMRWATSAPVSALRTSDPLRGERCICILRTAEVKERHACSLEEVREQAAKDYVQGGERELKRHFDENQWKYRMNERWKVEVVLAGPDGAKEIRALRKRCAESFAASKRADLDLNRASFPDAALETQVVTMDREQLKKDPRLSILAFAIPIAAREEPSEVFTHPDGKTSVFFVVKEKLDQKVPDLAEVKEAVRRDVLAERGLARARPAAERLLEALRFLRGEKLAAALEARGIKPVKTSAFPRGAIAIPQLPEGGLALVAETFLCQPGGGFERLVADAAAKRVYLVRCSRRVEPEESTLSSDAEKLLHDELLKARASTRRDEEMVSLTLRAKGVSPEHVEWVRARREGAGGRVAATLRQVFVPDDPATLDGWLVDAARKRVAAAVSALEGGAAWERVVQDYSEDEATKAASGEMTVLRGDLGGVYGFEFETQLFELPKDGQLKGPLRSKRGLHLVQVVAAAHPSRPDGPDPGVFRMTLRQIFVKTDAAARGLPAEVAERAHAIARKKIEEAKARIESGETFASVGAELGAPDDPLAAGEPFTVPHLSPIELAALAQPVETTAALLAKCEPFAVKRGDATEWHLLLSAPLAPGATPLNVAGPPRAVFECTGPSADSVLAARRELEAWVKERGERSPTPAELIREWKRIVAKRSTGESRKKEGAFGVVGLDPRLVGYGRDALAVLGELAPGERSGIVPTPRGFHLVECLAVETRKPDDAARRRAIGGALLDGTSWDE